jgi:hypothetical protein
VIKLHDQDQEFLTLCRQLDNKIGIVLVLDATNPGSSPDLPLPPDVQIALGLSMIQTRMTIASGGIKPSLLPIIGTIPDHTRLAGMKYALKVVLVDEELVKKQQAAPVVRS